ncbi:MAG: hypothetical protein OXJ53_09665 [Gammaproteobacteria bacterium]|nr:hypothetical protein [Gammaproteobacteria bacterium]MDE0273476.1 hypothetical protein [Gammaproteobacteria bacterium]
MTPLAVIAGIPLEAYRRKAKKPDFKPWQIRVIPSKHPRKAKLDEIWSRVVDAAGNDAEGNAHLILSHNRDSDRPRFEAQAETWCRVVWLPHQMARNYATSDFDDTIERLLSFEAHWRASIRPSLDSPLLLPETAFSAAKPVATMWRRARRVREDRDRIDAVEQLIRRFRARHHQEGAWMDVESLRFDRGTAHGGHHLLPSRRTKLTFRLPDGFHFDVSHQSKRPFSVHDQEGLSRRFQKYANICPHGYIRGGH